MPSTGPSTVGDMSPRDFSGETTAAMRVVDETGAYAEGRRLHRNSGGRRRVPAFVREKPSMCATAPSIRGKTNL